MERRITTTTTASHIRIRYYFYTKVKTLLQSDEQVTSECAEPAVHLDFIADARLSVWVGLSIIGALAVSLHRTPMIEEQPVGVYITREQYEASGCACVWAESDGNIITLDKKRVTETEVLSKQVVTSASKVSLITVPSAYNGSVEVHQGLSFAPAVAAVATVATHVSHAVQDGS